MSLCKDGLNSRVKGGKITVAVGGHPPSNSVGQSNRLGPSGRAGPARFRKNEKEVLVVGPKTQIKNSLGGYGSANVVQVDRPTYRNKNKNNGPLSSLFWSQYPFLLEMSRSHKDRTISKSPFSRDPQGNCRLYYKTGHWTGVCRPFKSRYRFNSARSKYLLSLGCQSND